MRLNLRVFRVGQKLTQAEMAKKIGCSLTSYNSIESGARNGSIPFLLSLQKAFNLSGDEALKLMETKEE